MDENSFRCRKRNVFGGKGKKNGFHNIVREAYEEEMGTQMLQREAENGIE